MCMQGSIHNLLMHKHVNVIFSIDYILLILQLYILCTHFQEDPSALTLSSTVAARGMASKQSLTASHTCRPISSPNFSRHSLPIQTQDGLQSTWLVENELRAKTNDFITSVRQHTHPHTQRLTHNFCCVLL